jgi:GTPase KRas protein
MSSKSSFIKEYKLVVVGGGGVGKSALTIQFIQVKFFSPRVLANSFSHTLWTNMIQQLRIPIESNALSTRKSHSWTFLIRRGRKNTALCVSNTCGPGKGFCWYILSPIKAGSCLTQLPASLTRPSFDEIQTFCQQILRVKDKCVSAHLHKTFAEFLCTVSKCP